MSIQTLNIEVTNAFSTVSTSLELKDLALIQKKTNKKLTEYLCEKIINGQLDILTNKFFTIWNSQDKETKQRLVDFFHVIVTTYRDSKHQIRNQQILLEDVSKYCLLEIAPLDYWIA